MDGFSHVCKSIGRDDFSQYSKWSSSAPTDHVAENASDTGTTSSTRNCGDEDEEDVIILASSHPKKRTGRKKFKETRHPVYRGVRRRNSNRWVCEVREPNQRNRIWLGTYPTAEMAARAHDVAALALRGRKTCLNFADSEWRLPKPASADQEDIQRAAAEAAAMFSIEKEEEEEEDVADTIHEDTAVTSTIGIDNDAFNGRSPRNETSQRLTFCYMDDEAIFDMPGLLSDMAEGLLLPAPFYPDGYSTEKDSDMSLWNPYVTG